ncbi:MAG: nucleotidyltransferase family protein [Prevotella sp.]|jgi:glucose-1-phosphate thymidylyltransferase|nr:nucleotidyltransferase family protein [Prevotella sp.]
MILAAGYATRLYPLTENFPKPLLEVAGKPILDWLIEDMTQTGKVDEYIVISNHKFAHIFEDWAANNNKVAIRVIDDGTTSNDNRLGAVKDIQFAIEQLGLDDDLLVMAGDNLLDFSLAGFIRYAQEKHATCVMRYFEAEEAKLHKTGVAEVADDDRLIAMEEKPAQPKSHWCVPAFYYYTKEDSRLIQKGIESGCGTDAPGSFIAWLCGQTNVYAWEMPGKRYDIGNLQSYEEVKRTFAALK